MRFILFFAMAALLASSVGAQGLGPRPTIPPKKFLVRDGTAKAGRLEVSISSVGLGMVEQRDGSEQERLLVKFAVRNTDPKKVIAVDLLLPTAADDSGNKYSANVIATPKRFDPEEVSQVVVAIEVPTKKAKAIRLVLANNIGWELKRDEWDKSGSP